MRGDKGCPSVSMALTESKHLGTPAIKGANRRASGVPNHRACFLVATAPGTVCWPRSHTTGWRIG